MGCINTKGENDDGSHLVNGSGHLSCCGGLGSPTVCKACSSTILACRVKRCFDCREIHCANCLDRDLNREGSVRICSKCLILSSGQFLPQDLMAFSVRELRQFLFRRKIATDNCKEKSDLIELVMLLSSSSEHLSSVDEHTQHLQMLRERMQMEQLCEAETMPSYSVDEPIVAGFGESPIDVIGPVAVEEDVVCSDVKFPVLDDDVEKIMKNNEGTPSTDEMSDAAAVKRRSSLVSDAIETDDDKAPLAANERTSVEITENNATFDATADEQLFEIRSTQIDLMEIDASADVTIENPSCHGGSLPSTMSHNSEEGVRLYKKDMVSSGNFTKGSCHLCLEKNPDCVFLECGHMVTCYSCGEKVSECPVCFNYISRRVRAFRA